MLSYDLQPIYMLLNEIRFSIGEGRYDQEKKYPIKSNQKMRYKENNSKRITNKYIKFNNKSLTLKNIPPPDLKSN